MEGWIKLHRKFIDWEWYKDKNTKILFIHLLLLANHKENKWQGQIIDRGQLVTSIKHLSKECGLTLQQTRTALNKLKSTNEITSKSTSKYSLITIVNYSVYQDGQEENNIQNNIQNNKQITNEQQTNNKQITTNKNIKNINNGNNEKNIIIAYETNIGNLTPFIAEKILSYRDSVSDEMILEAIKIATLNNKKNANYITGILNNWINKGYKVVADIQNDKKETKEPIEIRQAINGYDINSLYEN